MRNWLRGTPGALLALTVIALLVAGGLGWVTVAALRMEREQMVDRAETEHANRLRLALWRLDSYVAPLLNREDSRPFDHFSTVFAPALLLDNDGHPFHPGSVVQPSPLLDASLPDWMTLHFQVDRWFDWQSPQVPTERLRIKLSHEPMGIPMDNATEARKRLLCQFSEQLPASRLLDEAGLLLGPPTQLSRTVVLPPRTADPHSELPGQGQGQNFVNPNLPYKGQSREMLQKDYDTRNEINQRFNQDVGGRGGMPTRVNREVVTGNLARNGENYFGNNSVTIADASPTFIYLGRMTPHWFRDRTETDRLLSLRLVRIDGLVRSEDRTICQGVVIDPEELQRDLLPRVTDLFPEAQLKPAVGTDPEGLLNRMTVLPLQLDPGVPPVVPSVGWTGLRIGLALAWAAALFALVAVALGGWTLLDLSERRIQFVSAVTHELRTPLTTLRLYLEMLLDGMVRDETTRQEYLQTLHSEAERLARLVNNVLDYSRLEKAKPALRQTTVSVGDLLAPLHAAWTPRCGTVEKELTIETLLPAETTLTTDADLVQQILGNLIENACKYSREADDRRIWVRTRAEKGRIVIEVEDRGPGVPTAERRKIFRAFERGNVDSSTGGVGLGLALARRWAELLGGTLELAPASAEGGACFRLTLPAPG